MPISIDGSGSITGVSSLSNPSNIVVGTGVSIVSPSTNELSIRTNDAERIRVGAGGSVGIGTDNPDSKLHIRDLDSTITLEATRGSGRKYRIETTGSNAEGINIYDNATNQRAWLYYAGADPSTGSYHIFNTNGIERVRIDHVGRVRMPYQPAFLAYPSTTVNRSTGTFTWQFNTTVFNIGGHFNTSTYRFVAPVAGRYLFGANCRHDSANSDFFRTLFLLNGANGSFQTVGHVIADIGTVWGPRYYSFSVTYLANLNVNDYVEVASVANNDGAWTQNNESQFWGYLVG